MFIQVAYVYTHTIAIGAMAFSDSCSDFLLLRLLLRMAIIIFVDFSHNWVAC